jgi:hypothetical protein
VIDFEAKYKLVRQTKDDSSPVSIAAYFDMGMNTTEFPETDENYFFEDSTTVFKYKFAHRLAYNAQVVISRKFSHKFSLQLAPVFIYENLVEPGKENHTLALTASGRFKTGINSSLIFEYGHAMNNRSSTYVDPISIGYEVGTVGHTFQLVLSSSNQFLEQKIYTENSYDYTDSYIILGFNIKRTFWRKKK